MKNLYVCILALGLGNIVIDAAEVKQSAEQKEKDAATIALATAIYNLDIKGVTKALNDGASLTTLVRTYRHTPSNFFISTDPRWSYPCMAILVDGAKEVDPNFVLDNGTTAKEATTAIIALLIKHGLDINAPADIQDGTYVHKNAPLLAVFNDDRLHGHTNQALSNPYFVKALLDNGANIDQQSQLITMTSAHGPARTSGGATALMLAIAEGATNIFRLLLEYGADTTIKNANGHDVMYYIDKSDKKDEFTKILNQFKKTARQTVQREAAPRITRDPASLAADYFAGESAEEVAIRASKSPKEEVEEE